MSEVTNVVTLADEIDFVKKFIEASQKAVQANKESDLAPIEGMIKSLTQRLHREVIDMEEEERDALVAELLEIVGTIRELEAMITQSPPNSPSIHDTPEGNA